MNYDIFIMFSLIFWRANSNFLAPYNVKACPTVPHFLQLRLYCKQCDFRKGIFHISRSQWPRCLRLRSAAARPLRLWVRIPPGAWMFICCECFVLSGRSPCDEMITRPHESYRMWCVVVYDLETSWMRPTGGLSRQKQTYFIWNKAYVFDFSTSHILNFTKST